LASNLFENISGLKQIVLPHYLEKIGKNCFLNTTNLTSITVNSNIVLEPGSLATGRSTSLVINNQAFADNMSKYLPQEKYANVTLTRDVSTGG
jgi:hypothetical protein